MQNATSLPHTPNASTLEKFKDTLPDVAAREMWTQETYLEYRRFMALCANGGIVLPLSSSLLGHFVTLLGVKDCPCDNMSDGSAYVAMYGHKPSYCWTRDISNLTIESSTGSAPNSAWMQGR